MNSYLVGAVAEKAEKILEVIVKKRELRHD
jgi:hypothetical protein